MDDNNDNSNAKKRRNSDIDENEEEENRENRENNAKINSNSEKAIQNERTKALENAVHLIEQEDGEIQLARMYVKYQLDKKK